ncbi:MAG: hypothetical protein J6S43_01505 [Lentisphaeria bacterium]|nr:hypothetical protein [Lentisphaeria bacterium]
MIEQLPEPSMHFRPSPFWSWNADLKPEELRRQIRLMHQAGLGGFFMHARGGLETAYLSKEWMDCVIASLDEAGKLGMDAWLYDENGWPSGFAGGLVNALGVDYQAKYLRSEIIDAGEAAGKENTIAFYSADGSCLLGRSLPEKCDAKVMRCYYELNPYYVDNLNAEVVAEFLRVTHQHYYQNLPPQLLKHLRGVFTDEPQLSRNGVVWSFVLEEEYRKKYNCELLEYLPGLLHETVDCSQTRVRFWKLCSELFSQAFMKQVKSWCQEHNWELTGHHVLEEVFSHQISSNGSVMPQYRYYTLPGVDHLGRTAPSDLAAVQLWSVGEQYGMKQLMTESFACSGWACNFSGMRWIYQRQLAHGINYLCQHLQSYSLRGARKRDYPLSSFYHQPWWEDYKILNDYFSRTGMLLAEGKCQVSTLVIHPISSLWKLYTGNDAQLQHGLFQKTADTITSELDRHFIPHHYADEIIVDECGSVDNGRFIIGNCAYDRVIIPQITNISEKILDLLKQFHRAGGTVLRVRTADILPEFTVDGVPADAADMEFINSLPGFDSERAAAEYVAGCTEKSIAVTENGVPVSMICGSWRDIELSGCRGRFYYLVNTSQNAGCQVEIKLMHPGKVVIIDQYDGKFYRPDNISVNAGEITLPYSFAAADALMLFVSDDLEPEKLPEFKRFAPNRTAIRLLPETSWQISQIEENILTLDFCRFRVDNGDWQYANAIDVQSRLLQMEKDCDLELEYEFTIDEDFDFDTGLFMVIESPDKFTFALNGREFTTDKCGYLFDKAFERIRLPENLIPGRNVISMKLRFSQTQETYETLRKAREFESERNKLTFQTEIESIYLAGNFSVRHNGKSILLERNAMRLQGSFSLGAPLYCDRINCQDLLNNGMPFFAGKITLKNMFTLTPDEVDKINFFSCKLQGANSLKLRLNGQDCGGAFWEPFALNVRGKLQPGINVIEMELTFSLRNMLGPHHLLAGEPLGVGPTSFFLEPNCLGVPGLPSTKEYCMVESGVSDIKFTV